MTSGNHIWDKKEAIDYIGAEPRLLRPANYPAGVPGSGSYLSRTRDGASVGVINVMGRVFMLGIDDPFAVVLREIEALRTRARIIFVDFHAEATSEKIAMGWHLDGKVTALVGTHTHVQTADERILPKGTAYLTDVSMPDGRTPHPDRHRIECPRPRSARDAVLRSVGRRRIVELSSVEHRPSLLHAQGCLVPDPRNRLSIGAPIPEIQAG